MEEIAFQVMQPYVGNNIPETELRRILRETLDFPIPLVAVGANTWSLELFHGPTLAFKDVGARFMSRCLGYFLQGESRKVTILVATSGDTGGAVAHGFYNVPGIDVCILYPKGMVSPVQEKQLTALGGNIQALEVAGSFDDCQQLVKQAFADADLQQSHFLSSANSINVARWLPQQLYYFLALRQWPAEKDAPVVAVPSGNFGNICAGILSMQSGLPIKHFIAACNSNKMVADYFQTGQWEPRPAIATLSNAMDVGNPSNFIRILEIMGHQDHVLKESVSADWINDDDTLTGIRKLHHDFHYLADPHGAVAWQALRRYLEQHPGQSGIFLETAHPVKFPDAIRRAIGLEEAVPEQLQGLLAKEKEAIPMEADYNRLKELLQNR